MKTLTAALAVILALAAVPAMAAETEWTEIAPGARLRAISSGTEIDGRALIGLEIDLGPGLKTYWRVPGETGVPTRLEIADDHGPRDSELFWPLPQWDLSQGFVDLIYDGRLVLPALVTAQKGAKLSLKVEMGVCSDICVPVRASFDLPGANEPDNSNLLRLRQAMAETPIAWDGADPPLTDIALDRGRRALTLAYDPARIDPNRVFPSLDGALYVFTSPEIDAAAGRLSFRLLARPGDEKWRSLPLRISFATAEGPYEIVAFQ